MADVFIQLENIAASDDFVLLCDELTVEWTKAGLGLAAIEPVLRFMEANPDKDFGSPGPLVHFVEQFYGPEYRQMLVESIRRTPTSHTAWMLNRVINDMTRPDQRAAYLSVVRDALSNPAAGAKARQSLWDFLKHQLQVK